ncbi:MAG TPA: lysylphosphatidylglycerol synthase transmembrane domain-containing protein [Roseovarius sp.]
MMHRLFRLAVSASVIALLFAVIDLSELAARLRGADLRWLAVSVTGIAAITCLAAVRWAWVARELGLRLGYRRALREYFVAGLVNQVVPGGIVGDVARALRLTHSGDLRRAAQSVVVERVIGQVTTLAVLAGGLAVSLAVPGGIVWPWWTGWGVVLLVIFAAALIVRRDVDPSRSAFFAPLWSALCDHRQIALALLILLLLNFSFYASARAVGTDLPPAAFFTVIPLVLTAMMIPLSIGGWGWREGAAAALFPLAGATAAEGVATGIVYGASMLIAALPAALFLFHDVREPDAEHLTKPT